MEVIKYPDKSAWDTLLKRPEIDNSFLEKTVGGILDDVKINGDKAVLNYTGKFDKIKLSSLQVLYEEVEEAKNLVDAALKKAIILARSNIEKFHISQKIAFKAVETTPGVKCWQKAVPIEKVGLYVPAGTAPLFSTVLMLGIPAIIAGCKEIILCSPAGTEGKIHPSVLFAADYIGINKIYKIGGVQAIAAMAYGTETVPKVYKIFGPGQPICNNGKTNG